jgi:hypothetical protein
MVKSESSKQWVCGEERTGEYSPRRHGGHREKKIDNPCELCISVVKID